MKKLMLLGGSRYLKPVLDAAKKLGIYTVTADYLPDNYAHQYSDEYVNVSVIDKEKVLAVAQQLGIDGIMSFACDPGVVTAAYVAEQMGLPNVGPYKSVEILQNKWKFRSFLRDNGFNAPFAMGYKDTRQALNDIGKFIWPVIVKPTDSAGSKGVMRVDSADGLKCAIENALKFSHCNEFIVEEYLEPIGCPSDCDSFSIDGDLKIVTFSAQRFDGNAENIYTPAAYSWPSTISVNNQKYLSSEIQRLLKLLDMRTAIYNIETRECTNGKSYIMEISPRGGGNRLSEMIRYITDVDMITNFVRYTVGMEMEKIDNISNLDSWIEVIIHSEKPGIFNSVIINDEIKSNVIEKDLWVKPGDRIGGFSAANEAIGTIVLKLNSSIEIDSVVSDINKYVRVIVN